MRTMEWLYFILLIRWKLQMGPVTACKPNDVPSLPVSQTTTIRSASSNVTSQHGPINATWGSGKDGSTNTTWESGKDGATDTTWRSEKDGATSTQKSSQGNLSSSSSKAMNSPGAINQINALNPVIGTSITNDSFSNCSSTIFGIIPNCSAFITNLINSSLIDSNLVNSLEFKSSNNSVGSLSISPNSTESTTESLEDQVDKFMQRMKENFQDEEKEAVSKRQEGGLQLKDLYTKDFDNKIRSIDTKADWFTNNNQIDNRTAEEKIGTDNPKRTAPGNWTVAVPAPKLESTLSNMPTAGRAESQINGQLLPSLAGKPGDQGLNGTQFKEPASALTTITPEGQPKQTSWPMRKSSVVARNQTKEQTVPTVRARNQSNSVTLQTDTAIRNQTNRQVKNIPGILVTTENQLLDTDLTPNQSHFKASRNDISKLKATETRPKESGKMQSLPTSQSKANVIDRSRATNESDSQAAEVPKENMSAAQSLGLDLSSRNRTTIASEGVDPTRNMTALKRLEMQMEKISKQAGIPSPFREERQQLTNSTQIT